MRYVIKLVAVLGMVFILAACGSDSLQSGGDDNDGDGAIQEIQACYLDEDRDGYGDPDKVVELEYPPSNCIQDITDCDDADETIFPGAPEICDGLDNNCNDEIDEGDACGVCEDGDERDVSCGIGECAATGSETCVDGQWADNTCVPGTPTEEICDGLDNNCNGEADDGIEPAATTCGVGACAGNTGVQECTDGTAIDSCDPYAGATEEICDEIDNDCDGEVDEGLGCVCNDGDTRATACGVGECAAIGTETCVNGQWANNTCVSGSPVNEICDGLDNDCNGEVDNGIAETATTCGVGECAGTGVLACVNGGLVDSCQQGTPADEVCDGLDNDCNGDVDDGLVCGCLDGDTREVTCGVGECVSTGTETCVNGQWADSTCVPGDSIAEICDGLDNDCNGEVDNGIAEEATTCGIGECAGTGILACVGGELVDSCQEGTPTDEVCDGLDNNCDGTADEGVLLTFYEDADIDAYGNAAVTTEACAAPTGYIDDNTDCDDGNADVNPGMDEICDNDIDDNCDGLTDDEDTEACAPTEAPLAPINVSATDCDPVNYDPDHANITITWEPNTEGSTASYYQVYRATYDEDNPYELVSAGVTETSYEFVQTWDDVLDTIGPAPGLSPTADFDDANGTYPERQAFIDALIAYRDYALPTVMDFKAPAFFKVEACNALGCSDLSEADAGSAEYVHTEIYSEVALHLIPSWNYAQLLALADMPPEDSGLNWCGIDLCGSGGGIARGRVSEIFQMDDHDYVNIDVQYENFTETDVERPGSYFKADGTLGGRMLASRARNGELILSGDFVLSVNGRPDIDLAMFAYIGNYYADLTTRFTEGWATITYKGLAYQFTLPIQPADGVSGNAAVEIEPVVPIQSTQPSYWNASETQYPLPVVDTDGSCLRVWTDYAVPTCTDSIAP